MCTKTTAGPTSFTWTLKETSTKVSTVTPAVCSRNLLEWVKHRALNVTGKNGRWQIVSYRKRLMAQFPQDLASCTKAPLSFYKINSTNMLKNCTDNAGARAANCTLATIVHRELIYSHWIKQHRVPKVCPTECKNTTGILECLSCSFYSFPVECLSYYKAAPANSDELTRSREC